MVIKALNSWGFCLFLSVSVTSSLKFWNYEALKADLYPLVSNNVFGKSINRPKLKNNRP